MAKRKTKASKPPAVIVPRPAFPPLSDTLDSIQGYGEEGRVHLAAALVGRDEVGEVFIPWLTRIGNGTEEPKMMAPLAFEMNAKFLADRLEEIRHEVTRGLHDAIEVAKMRPEIERHVQAEGTVRS